MMIDNKLALRAFLFEPDGTLRRLSIRSFGRLVSRRGALPQFSSQSIRSVEVTLEIENRRPVSLVKTILDYWIFDASGKFNTFEHVRRAQLRLHALRLNPAGKTRKVFSFAEIREAKEIVAASKWTLSEAEQSQIIGAIWPQSRLPGMLIPTYLEITE
jgi:hypothetical protein